MYAATCTPVECCLCSRHRVRVSLITHVHDNVKLIFAFFIYDCHSTMGLTCYEMAVFLHL